MDFRNRIRSWALLAAALVILGGGQRAAAVEEFQRFLEALRRNAMYDHALDYLDSMRTSPLITDEQRQMIDYELGLLLTEQARSIRDVPLRMQKLDAARDAFTRFVEEFPEHPQAAMANTQLGNVLVERGRALIERSKSPTQEAQKPKLLEEARKYLTEAKEVFENAEVLFEDKVEQYPKGPLDNPKLDEERRVARVNLIQSRLFTARVYEEMSNAYEEGSEEYKNWLTQAAERYKVVYEKYRRWMGGLYALMYLGNCHYKLGDTKQALAYFSELLEQPDRPEFRPLRTKTLRLAMLCWTSPGERKHQEAIRRGEEWIKTARPDEERSPEGLAIRWLTVVAYDLAREDAKDNRNAQAAMQKQARPHAQFVANQPGEYAKDAKTWLAANGANIDTSVATTFDEAFDLGREQLNVMQITKDPQQQSEARAKAKELFRQALSLRAEDTPVERVNQVRYFLTFLSYQDRAYYEAAVLGDFISRRYPDSSTARPGAYLAMVAWLQALKDQDEDQRDFEVARLMETATYITDKWPGQQEADQAVMVLVEFFVKEGNLEKALELLAKIPEDSPRRGDADLKAGQALWALYLKESARQGDEQRSATELQEIFDKAQQTLQGGIDRMRSAVASGGSPTYDLLAAELSLAQMYLDNSEPAKAVELLAAAKPEGTSALDLVKAKDPTTTRGNFAIETYKAALRGFVGTQQLDEAEAVMAELDKLGGDDATALTRIYISLGRSLEQQLKLLRDQKRDEEAKKVSAAFEAFLEKIASRPGNTYNSLYWIASTFRSLGLGLDGQGRRAGSKEAAAYYVKAGRAYQRILKEISRDSNFAEPGADLAVKIRMAEMMRRSGSPKQAADMLVEVLREKPKSLEAQMEAAYCYQDRGASEDPKWYLSAINGARRIKGTNQNLIWGWYQLQQVLSHVPKLADAFHEARTNQLECQLQYALSLPGEERKKKLATTKRFLQITAQTYPELGGEYWADQYENLARRVDEQLGIKYTPLQGGSRGRVGRTEAQAAR